MVKVFCGCLHDPASVALPGRGLGDLFINQTDVAYYTLTPFTQQNCLVSTREALRLFRPVVVLTSLFCPPTSQGLASGDATV